MHQLHLTIIHHVVILIHQHIMHQHNQQHHHAAIVNQVSHRKVIQLQHNLHRVNLHQVYYMDQKLVVMVKRQQMYMRKMIIILI